MPVSKGYIWYDYVPITLLKKDKTIMMKCRLVTVRDEEWEEGVTTKR